MADNIINEEEFSAAEVEARKSGGVYVHEFKKPITYNGKTYTELTFEWDKLTGNDSRAIVQEVERRGKTVVAPAFSVDYLVRMAARACTEKIGIDAFDLMSIRDFNMIWSAARSFLMALEL